MFVPDGHFQPSLMYAIKAKAYQMEAPFKCSTLELASGLTNKHLTRLERPGGQTL
jgi:hypothetical protein